MQRPTGLFKIPRSLIDDIYKRLKEDIADHSLACDLYVTRDTLSLGELHRFNLPTVELFARIGDLCRNLIVLDVQSIPKVTSQSLTLAVHYLRHVKRQLPVAIDCQQGLQSNAQRIVGVGQT
uniref:Uncharacterized protein n=1 Tax=Strigamia maritima TaxID=126957 RepID=T1JJF0_STRMM